MTDQREGKSKKRHAPVPPTGLGENQTREERDVSLDLETESRVDTGVQKVSAAAKENPKTDRESQNATPENQNKDWCPKEAWPFADTFEFDLAENGRKTCLCKERVSNDDNFHEIPYRAEISNGGEILKCASSNNDGKKGGVSPAGENRIPYYHPKGLMPFSDESGKEAPKPPPLKSLLTCGTPRPPPRTKRRARRGRKQHDGRTELTRDVEDNTKDSGLKGDRQVETNVTGKITVVEYDEKRKTEAEKETKKGSETKDLYPEHLNPFAGDSDTEETVLEDGIPRKNTDGTKQSHAEIEDRKNPPVAKLNRKSKDLYPEHLNPFGGDSESEHTDDEVESSREVTTMKGLSAQGGTRDKTERCDTWMSGEFGSRGKGKHDYPDELNPFSGDVEISGKVDEGGGSSGLTTVNADKGAPRETRMGRIKTGLKSMRRLIGRFTACTRSQR